MNEDDAILFPYNFVKLADVDVYRSKKNVVKAETLYVPHLPESFLGRSVFFISDIHHRRIPPRLLKGINNVDFVLIGGDLMEKGVPFQRVLHNIRQLKKIGPVVFVWGNNDGEVSAERLRTLLHEEGVTLLENESIFWERGDTRIEIAGVGNKDQAVDDSFLHADNRSDMTILVTHDPAVVHKLSNLKTICAALTGHTHGGQIRFGPVGLREKGGWKVRSGIPLLISNGYGTTKVPLRWGAPSETHLITLKRK
ncbi:metallophosphoesterase [Salibacterium salarium]|nr:metallophosphoesterase [Salibacterium salarium]